MKKILLPLICCIFLFSKNSEIFAAPGDTTTIYTQINRQLTYTGNYDSTVTFPDTSVHYRKILMHLVLGRYSCPPGSQYCGSWDYINGVYCIPSSKYDSFELARYITPYAGERTPGYTNEVIYDLTDYASILHGSTIIRYFFGGYSYGFTVTVYFQLIEGTPPRNPVAVKKLWSGEFTYTSGIDTNFTVINDSVNIPETQASVRLNITGHGGDNSDCEEFCYHYYDFSVNDSLIDQHVLFRECGLNELYPQGGTWLYERDNWCPGAKVVPVQYEMTPFLKNSKSLNFKFGMEPYNTIHTLPNTSPAYIDLEAHLIKFQQPNFNLNTSIEDIIAPNDKDEYYRENPICFGLIVVIRNSGMTQLSSLDINYGVINGEHQDYHWTGLLNFLQSDTIHLPVNSTMFGSDSAGWFEATISSPNGGSDENSDDNYIKTRFAIPPQYPNPMILNIKTNIEVASPTVSVFSWFVFDSNGDTILKRSQNKPNTIYADTLHFAPGCCSLQVNSISCEGLYWWAFSQGGTGYCKISDHAGNQYNIPHYNGGDINTGFNANGDFGCGFTQNFTVGYATKIPQIDWDKYFRVSPIPSGGIIHLNFSIIHPESASIRVFNLLGQPVYQSEMPAGNSNWNLDLSRLETGMYHLHVEMNGTQIDKRIVIQH